MSIYVGDIETVSTPDRGRGVRCTRDVKRGTTLLREGCIACVLCGNARGSYCDHCLLPGYDRLLRCSGCKFARYCNRKCQKNAWIDHKEECRGLQRVAPNIPTDTVRLLARIMRRAKRLPDPEVTIDGKHFPLTVGQLQGDVAKMLDQRRADTGAVLFVLKEFLGGDFIGFTADDVLRLFVVVEINGFHLFDHELKNIGYALYQRASMVNHNCEPNCLVVFDGPVLEVRSLQDLRAGEELLITYIELLATTETRRYMLMDQFQFHCVCSKCVNPFTNEVLKCLSCQSPGCQGFMRHVSAEELRCSLCSSVLSPSDTLMVEVDAAEKEAEGFLESANRFRKEERWTDMLSSAEQCLRVAHLHPHHFAKLRARNIAMDAHIELQNWQEALLYGEENLESYKHQYQLIHPSMGVQLMRVGKLYNYLGNVPEALKMFQQADSIISVTHDSQHALHRVLQELLTGCHVELRSMATPSLDPPDQTGQDQT